MKSQNFEALEIEFRNLGLEAGWNGRAPSRTAVEALATGRLRQIEEREHDLADDVQPRAPYG